MAQTQKLPKVDYKADGIKKEFKIPFKFQDISQVKVYVENQEVEYVYVKNSTVRLTDTPASGLIVSIRRKTDISSIVETWSKGERFTAQKQNKIQQQIFQALQEIDQEEIDSLDSFINGDMYLKLDMNGYRIIETADPQELTDAVPRQFFIDMFPALPVANEAEVGLKIGDTYLSSRTDEEVELVGGIQKNIPRDVEQILTSADYPELATIYGDVGGFTTLPIVTAPDEGSGGGIEDITLLQSGFNVTNYGSIRALCKDKNNDIFYYGDGANLRRRSSSVDELVYTFPTTIESANINANGTIVVTTNTSMPNIYYSTDNGVTFNNCVIPGSPSRLHSVLYINNVFFATPLAISTSSSSDNCYLYYSTDGITWLRKNLVNDFGMDFTKMENHRNLETRQYSFKTFWYEDGFYYWAPIITTVSSKYVVYKIQSDFSSATEHLYVPLTSPNSRFICFLRSDNFCLGYNNLTSPEILYVSTDGMVTETAIDLSLITADINTVINTIGITYFIDTNTYFVAVSGAVDSYILKTNDDFQTITLEETISNSTSPAIFGYEYFENTDSFWLKLNNESFQEWGIILGSTTVHKHYTVGK